jgi:hypothetical protein
MITAMMMMMTGDKEGWKKAFKSNVVVYACESDNHKIRINSRLAPLSFVFPSYLLAFLSLALTIFIFFMSLFSPHSSCDKNKSNTYEGRRVRRR